MATVSQALLQHLVESPVLWTGSQLVFPSSRLLLRLSRFGKSFQRKNFVAEFAANFFSFGDSNSQGVHSVLNPEIRIAANLASLIINGLLRYFRKVSEQLLFGNFRCFSHR